MGTYKTESLPNHYHVQAFGTSTGGTNGERFGVTNVGRNSLYYESGGTGALPTGANTSNVYGSSAYQTNAPVQPNALLIQCCIKY